MVGQFTTGFHEYEAVFLYASDVLLITFLILFSIAHSYVLKNVRMSFVGMAITVFLLSAATSILFAYSKGLAVYNFVRLVLLILTALATGQLIRGGVLRVRTIFTVIAASAIFQSLIGIAQFFRQASLGLGILGESVLGPTVGGAAKIIVEGAPILRAYGTLPHPNVLAAFLLLGLFALYYLWLRNTKKLQIYETIRGNIFHIFVRNSYSTALTSGIFLISLGLLLTFSRTAWAIAILTTLAVIGYALTAKERRRQAAGLLITLSAIGALLLAAFSPYVFSRAQVSVGEPALVQRLDYNELGWDLIKKFPLGIGIGNQVLSSVKNGFYQQFGMNEVWQWQPIHNIYILIGSEIGILGGAAFLLFLLSLLISNVKFLNSKQIQNYNNQNVQTVIVIVMLSSLLVFGLFDHFLWTLQPGRLMLWLIIGILLASAHSIIWVREMPE